MDYDDQYHRVATPTTLPNTMSCRQEAVCEDAKLDVGFQVVHVPD